MTQRPLYPSASPAGLGDIKCDLAGHCGGCSWIEKPYSQQVIDKRTYFLKQWQQQQLPIKDLTNLVVHSIQSSGLRDRLDFMFKRKGGHLHFGLYDLQHQTLLDINHCPQLSPRLQDWLAEFRRNQPPLELGSIRLRIAPDGQRGAWLDFSHQDVRDLLNEREWLLWLMDHAIVEIGQRRKRLVLEQDILSLNNAELFPWFETYLIDQQTMKSAPLFTTIGSFSQVGFTANRAIIVHFTSFLPEDLSGNWLELGAGSGNLTLALAHHGREAGIKVNALEIDPLAVRGLQKSAEHAQLQQSIMVQKMDFQHGRQQVVELLTQAKGLVVDPPRNGLGQTTAMLQSLPKTQRPQTIIYLSCFAESMTADIKQFYGCDYRLTRICSIDQFPQSPHCEYLARLELE